MSHLALAQAGCVALDTANETPDATARLNFPAPKSTSDPTPDAQTSWGPDLCPALNPHVASFGTVANLAPAILPWPSRMSRASRKLPERIGAPIVAFFVI